jgi:ABC-type transporter Mla subunit MlaD
MADARPDPLADIFTLFAAPLSGTVRSIEQFRKGVDEFLKGVENFNRAMENLNETSERINALLADVEQPIRAAVPQITRTVKAADDMMQVVSGPAMAVAPGLNRLAETLSTPAFAQLPSQISLFSDVLGDVSKRLAPLTQMAESAGGLFGGFRLPGTRPSTTSSAAPPASTPAAGPASQPPPAIVEELEEDDEPPASPASATKKTPARKRAAAKKKAPAKKRAAAKKKAPAKKRAAAKKQAPAKKAAGRPEPRPYD